MSESQPPPSASSEIQEAMRIAREAIEDAARLPGAPWTFREGFSCEGSYEWIPAAVQYRSTLGDNASCVEVEPGGIRVAPDAEEVGRWIAVARERESLLARAVLSISAELEAAKAERDAALEAVQIQGRALRDFRDGRFAALSRAERCEKALREYLACALTSDETRLLMVGTNAGAMARGDERARSLHSRCDRIRLAEDAARAALSPEGGAGESDLSSSSLTQRAGESPGSSQGGEGR